MFQYLHSLSRSYGYWDTPPLHQQGRRVSKELLSIMVSPPVTTHRRGGNLVQWRSSRQDLIAKSTCEAELIASSEALQQGESISIVISEVINASCDIEVSSDDAAALHMVRNGSETAWRTRHIALKPYGYIRCPGERSSSHINLPPKWQLIA